MSHTQCGQCREREGGECVLLSCKCERERNCILSAWVCPLSLHWFDKVWGRISDSCGPCVESGFWPRTADVIKKPVCYPVTATFQPCPVKAFLKSKATPDETICITSNHTLTCKQQHISRPWIVQWRLVGIPCVGIDWGRTRRKFHHESGWPPSVVICR